MKKVIVLLLVLGLLLVAVAPAFARVGAPGAPGFGSNTDPGKPKSPPTTDAVTVLLSSDSAGGTGTGGGWGAGHSGRDEGIPGWSGPKGN